MGTVITWEILSYFMALIGVKEFSDLGSMISDQFNLTDPKLLKTEDLAISMSKQPIENTGGVDLGLNVNSLEYDNDNDTYKATKTGSIFAASAPAVVKILLNALGVNVMSTPEVNQKVADALNTAFNIGVTTTTMNLYKIPVIIKDGLTYLSEGMVKKLSDALYTNGVFSTGGITFPNFISGEEYTIDRDLGVAPALNDISNNFQKSSWYNYQCRYTIIHWLTKTADIDALIKTVTPNIIAASYGVSVSNYASKSFFINCQCITSPVTGIATTNNNGLVVLADIEIVSIRIECWYDPGTDEDDIAIKSSTTSNTNLFLTRTTTLANPSTTGTIWSNSFLAEMSPAVEGIDVQIGATTPADNDIDLDTTYPNWVANSIDIGWHDKTANLLRQGKLLPIDLTDIGDNALTGDFTRTQTQTQTGELDKTKKTTTKAIADEATDTVPFVRDVEDEVVVPADIPDVVPEPTPPVVIPTGTTSAGLATIYNPTEAQVNALKGDLWSQNIITTLQSIFLNNPMDAIISLNKVFCTPHTNGTATIKLGYVQTSVTGVKTVDDQYTTIDCGTVNVPEIYGNTTDYEPYTNVSVFLPFIGIQNLSAKDVVGGKLQIIYRVDVTTGTCIAQLFVTKEGVKQMLYSFEGNCAVEIPLSGSNANRAIIGLASITASTVAPGAGLALAGGAMNLVNGVNLQRSGGFQSNAGAMNNKKPYLIINRVLPYEAAGYNQIYGYPSNNRVLLNSVTGYTRVKEVHVEGISCTDYEKNIIEEQLKAGILL